MLNINLSSAHIFIATFLFIGLPQLKSQSPEDKIEVIDTPFEKGKIKNGNKSGVWMYYDTPNDLAVKINYTTGQLQFLKTDTTAYAIKIDNEWRSMKLDVPPRYIGSMNDFKKVNDEIKIPSEMYENMISGTFYISFEIDTLGSAINYQVINELSPSMSRSVITELQKIPNYWLVAQKAGQHYETNLIIAVTITMFNDEVLVKPQNKPIDGVDLFYLYDITLKGVTRTRTLVSPGFSR